MSKNAIEGSAQFFSILEEFCTNRGTDIVNPGSPRYVAGPHDSVDFYIKSQFLDKIVVHPACRFSLVEYCNETIILSYGVNGGSGLPYLQEQEVGPGELTYMVIEHKLFPSVDAAMVSDFIGAGEIGLSGYSGHQLDDALMLFKPIKRFSISPLMALDFQRICFEIAIDAAFESGHWMSSNLLNDLKALSDLGLELPFRNLVRSLSDSDPSSLFLSLYRCLEATYAYKICRKLVNDLALELSWIEMYKIMDVQAKWRPRELDSLEYILSKGSKNDHISVLKAITLSNKTNPKKSADLIYELRNALVHFKPYQSIDDIYENVDWDKLCRAMAGYICDIYQEIKVYKPRA